MSTQTKPSMTEDAAFRAWAAGCKGWPVTGPIFNWRIDPIHSKPNDLLVFTSEGGTTDHGSYMHYLEVNGVGELSVGTYEDARPHIGDALFKRAWAGPTIPTIAALVIQHHTHLNLHPFGFFI